MPVMSRIEQAFCRTPAWSRFAGRSVLPWAVHDEALSGDVLEMGSGSGAMAQQMARRFPDARITASDLDERMVLAARRRLDDEQGIAAVQQADVTALPFEDEQFDVVVSFLMLHHVISWEQALHEAFRVLRPGGSVLGYDLLDTTLTRWVHRIDRSPFRLIKRSELVPALTQSGFEQCRADVSMAGLVVRFRAVKPATAA